MAIQMIIEVCRRFAAGALLTLVLVAVDANKGAFAQEDDKSVGELRKEAETAEKELYAVFNDINSDDDYDFKCKRERSLGSRRKVQVCTPKFARRMESNRSAEQLGQGTWDAPASQSSQMQKKNDAMREEMSDLLAANTEFNEAFTKFAAAKRAYEAKLHSK